jgi:Flp pilus assembly protein TadG
VEPFRRAGGLTPLLQLDWTPKEMKNSRNNIEIFSERGQTMTEFAVVLPILCVLLFGIIQFGILYNNYVTVTDAARAGARKAAVSRHTSPSSEGCKTVRSSAATLDQARLGCSVGVVGPLDRPGADVTVTVTYPYSINLIGIPLKAGTLTAKTTERME